VAPPFENPTHADQKVVSSAHGKKLRARTVCNSLERDEHGWSLRVTFEVALFISGILLILVGLVGRIKARELEVGTDSKVTRVIVGVLGAAFVALSFGLALKEPNNLRSPERGEQSTTVRPGKSLPYGARIMGRESDRVRIYDRPLPIGKSVGAVRNNARVTLIAEGSEEGVKWFKARIDGGWAAVQNRSTAGDPNVKPYPCPGTCKAAIDFPTTDDCLAVRESPNRPQENARDNLIVELCHGTTITLKGNAQVGQNHEWRRIVLDPFWFRESHDVVIAPTD